jgi:hypothetical protein
MEVKMENGYGDCESLVQLYCAECRGITIHCTIAEAGVAMCSVCNRMNEIPQEVEDD